MAKKSAAPVQTWLFKEEPENYSLAQLKKDRDTVWSGITNNLALKNLRQVQPGDRVLYYHTGKEKAIVGEMSVIKGPMPDPSQPDDPKRVVVQVKYEQTWPRPVSLEEIKKNPIFASWELVRIPRLSILPVPAELLAALHAMAQAPPQSLGS